MRKKENSDDYRYFPDPDLVPIVTSNEKLARLKSEIPELPDDRKKKYINNYGLTAYDAELITNEPGTADYFETAAEKTKYPKIAANLVISDVMTSYDPETEDIPVEPEHLAQIADMLGDGEINSSVGKSVLKSLWENDCDAYEYIEKNNLKQISDESKLKPIIDEIIKANPKSVSDYLKGKTAAAKALMGQVMRKTSGRANPTAAEKIIVDSLEKLKEKN